jgi:hypothetical protein
MDDSARFKHVLDLRPTHAVPTDPAVRVRRLGGRPRKVECRPTIDELDYVQALNAARAVWVEGDELVRAFGDGCDPENVVGLVRARIARETAALKFERLRAEERGRDVADLCCRRIDGLLKLAHVELSRVKAGIDLFDSRSTKVRLAVQLLCDQIGEVAREVLSVDMAERVVEAFDARVEGWENHADH